MARLWSVLLFVWMLTLAAGMGTAQSLGNAGTVTGTVTDPSGAAVPKAAVEIHNPLTEYRQAANTGPDGKFRLLNVPPNTYHLDITANGFQQFTQDIRVRNAVPVDVSPVLALAGASTSVTVEAGASDVVETVPSDHVDVDRTLLDKLPNTNPGGGLSSAIIYSTGGVAADANGFFHPLGDHGEVSYVLDGQPVTDQQSKIFSTQLPASAVQGMELITGTPGAEFGDKTSLVAQITTRSALNSGKFFGSVEAGYGNLGNAAGEVSLGYGTAKWGNFIALDGTRSGRFLDSPEFTPFHDIGNNQTIFDRLDFQPTTKDIFHLNLFTARNWIQVPNDYDQLTQDQRQRVLTWSIAPGYQHTFGATTLLTVNPYIRKDQFNYYPSATLTKRFPGHAGGTEATAELGGEGGRGNHPQQPPDQVRSGSEADAAARKLSVRADGPGVQLAVPRCRRQPGGGHLADRARTVRGGRICVQYGGQPRGRDAVRAQPAELRPDAGREAVFLPRRSQHRPVRLLRAG